MPKKVHHITIEHLCYLMKEDCCLTFKADGVFHKEDIFNGYCEYEKLDDGRELVFDYVTEENKDQDVKTRMEEYCKLSNFSYPEFDVLNSKNFMNIMEEYIKFYFSLKIDVIPKLYLKINKKDTLQIIKIIYDYFPQMSYPTDGWIVVPTEVKYTAKIKPMNQLTIDLYHIKGNFYDCHKNLYVIENNKRLKNRTIYRCYFKDNKWFPREERPDKRYANSNYVVNIVQNQLNFKLLIQKINFMNNNYYDNPTNGNNLDFLQHLRDESTKWLLECKNKKCLDIGCGKCSSYLMWKEIGVKKVVGLDIDPICIFKSTALSGSNNYILFNFNLDWSLFDQSQYFGEVWKISQQFKMRSFYDKFDYIVFNFSIHYSKNYINLINQLSRVIKSGTVLKFNWIDYRNINIFDISISDNIVRMKLPWKDNYNSENTFNSEEFHKCLVEKKWTQKSVIKIRTFHEKYKNWQENIYYETWVFNS